MMRFLLLLIVLLFYTGRSYAQGDIPGRIQYINQLAASIDTLNPRKESDWEMIEMQEAMLTDTLLDLLNDSSIIHYPVDSLIRIPKVISDDRRVIVFSIRENTRGAIRSHINIIHYRPEHALPGAALLYLCHDEPRGAYYPGVIEKIYTLGTKNKKQYLLEGAAQPCASCKLTYDMLINTGEAGYTAAFCISFEFRSNAGYVRFDPKRKILSYDYLNYYGDALYYTECIDGEFQPNADCRKRGKFKYNGNTFVAVGAH
jgi:hypothetical protein